MRRLRAQSRSHCSIRRPSSRLSKRCESSTVSTSRGASRAAASRNPRRSSRCGAGGGGEAHHHPFPQGDQVGALEVAGQGLLQHPVGDAFAHQRLARSLRAAFEHGGHIQLHALDAAVADGAVAAGGDAAGAAGAAAGAAVGGAKSLTASGAASEACPRRPGPSRGRGCSQIRLPMAMGGLALTSPHAPAPHLRLAPRAELPRGLPAR